MSAATPAKSAGYSVARAQGACHVCNRAIAPGEKLLAALRETPAALERLDICPACWESFDKAGLLGYWQTVMPAATARKKLFVDDDVLCELFERLADTEELAKIQFRFVLGLILMRKRRLVYEGSRIDDGRETWIVRPRGREEKLEMLNPRLEESQIADVGNQLSEILNADV